MRQLPPIFTMLTLTTLLASCTNTHQTPAHAASNMLQRQSVVSMSDEYYPAKNPETIAIYNNNESPHAAYRVIGLATVSKHNLFGSPRHDTTMNTMMKKLAASMGGDGLINVNESDEALQAHVIAYQKILI